MIQFRRPLTGVLIKNFFISGQLRQCRLSHDPITRDRLSEKSLRRVALSGIGKSEQSDTIFAFYSLKNKR